jgi:3-oxoacyl-[acyl-carrier-protein] synthase-1
MLPEALCVCGLGASTPVGRSALSAAAAVRAGIAGFRDHPFMVDEEGEPMVIAECRWLREEIRIERRIAACLVEAIGETLGPLRERSLAKPRLQLFAALPAGRPGLPDSLAASVGAAVEEAFPGSFERIELAQTGHAGGLLALASAARALAAGATACVIAGADSYMAPDTLEWLEGTSQLHGAGPRKNAWGFVPRS